MVAVFLDGLDEGVLAIVLRGVDGDVGGDDTPDDGGGEEIGAGDVEEGFDVEERFLVVDFDTAGVEHVGDLGWSHCLTLVAQLLLVITGLAVLEKGSVTVVKLEEVVETYMVTILDQRQDSLLLEGLQDLVKVREDL